MPSRGMHEIGPSPRQADHSHVGKEDVQDLHADIVNVVPWIAVSSWSAQILPAH